MLLALSDILGAIEGAVTLSTDGENGEATPAKDSNPWGILAFVILAIGAVLMNYFYFKYSRQFGGRSSKTN